jgi:hypothetical protein
MRRPFVATLLVLGLALVAGANGCSTTDGGIDLLGLIRPVVAPSPDAKPDSPANALRLLEWSYNNRSIAWCTELFARDYQFVFSPLDTVGLRYQDTPWGRDDELISTAHLFSGGSTQMGPASRISFTLDRNFLVYPDPRSSDWDPEGRRHKKVVTQILVSVETADGHAFVILGAATFYLVRGDSADIPADLVARGFRPDSTRWWITRWDDEEGPGGGTPDHARAGRVAEPPPVLAPLPASNKTLGWLKAMYR